MNRSLLAWGLLVLPATPAAGQVAGPVPLDEAVRLALAFHPQIQLARAVGDDASASLSEARAARIPTVTVDATVTRFQESMIVAPLHDFDPTSPPLFDQTLLQSQWRVGYTLFDGGARGGQIRQAAALVQAADAGAAAAEMAVLEGVANAYLRALTAREVDDAQRRRSDALIAERDRVERLLREGTAARVELLRVDAALASAQADRIRTQTELGTALRDLARQIGFGDSSLDPEQIFGVRAEATAIDDVPTLAARAKTANPDLRRARQRRLAEEAGYRISRAAWLPTIRIVGGVVTFGSGGGDFSGEWQGGLALSYPLFTGGVRSSRVARGRARVEAADEEIRVLELQIETTIDRAVAAVAESEARVEALTRNVEHLTEVTRIEQLALEVGAGVQTEYLRAEADLFAARAVLAEVRHGALAARIALARATGDLSADWIAQNLETDR